jgi:hypothetical protein
MSELRSVGYPLIGYILGLWSRSVMATQYVIYSLLYITMSEIDGPIERPGIS